MVQLLSVLFLCVINGAVDKLLSELFLSVAAINALKKEEARKKEEDEQLFLVLESEPNCDDVGCHSLRSEF